jgi:hypothetical protein
MLLNAAAPAAVWRVNSDSITISEAKYPQTDHNR